jgi:hypothetical protein
MAATRSTSRAAPARSRSSSARTSASIGLAACVACDASRPTRPCRSVLTSTYLRISCCCYLQSYRARGPHGFLYVSLLLDRPGAVGLPGFHVLTYLPFSMARLSRPPRRRHRLADRHPLGLPRPRLRLVCLDRQHVHRPRCLCVRPAPSHRLRHPERQTKPADESYRSLRSLALTERWFFGLLPDPKLRLHVSKVREAGPDLISSAPALTHVPPFRRSTWPSTGPTLSRTTRRATLTSHASTCALTSMRPLLRTPPRLIRVARPHLLACSAFELYTPAPHDTMTWSQVRDMISRQSDAFDFFGYVAMYFECVVEPRAVPTLTHARGRIALTDHRAFAAGGATRTSSSGPRTAR